MSSFDVAVIGAAGVTIVTTVSFWLTILGESQSVWLWLDILGVLG